MSTKKLKSKKHKFQKRKFRLFSEEFKRTKVEEILENRATVIQISELYNVSRTTIYRWLYKYSSLEQESRQVVEMESEALKTKMLMERVAELERIIGQKQLEIDLLDKTLEIAGSELGYDLKKKYAAKSSNGSKPTKKT
jgi:transposase